MAPGKHFFPMAKGEKIALVTLIAFAVASFLLVGRTTEIAGMALFGWLMAGLMVLSPILTLWVYRRRPPRS
jgi:hypothetical protein